MTASKAVPLNRARFQLAHRLRLATVVADAGVSVFLLGLIAFFSFKTTNFFTFDNALIILADIAVLGVVAIGQTIAIISGGFDLSTSGVMPLGSIVFADFLNQGHSFPVALLMTIVVGMAVGVFNGFLITRVGINALIVTLGTLSITAGAAASIANGVSIPFDNPEINILARASVGRVENTVWIFLGLCVLATLILKYTTYGRSVYAIGGNEEASRLAGLRVGLTVWSVYLISGALSAFAGAIIASELLTGSTTIGTDSALTSITAVILGGGSLAGGVGSIAGTLIGVLVLGVLRNGLALMHVQTFYQQIATGFMLVAAVALSRVRYMRLGSWFGRGRREVPENNAAVDVSTPPENESGRRD
jgi:ribose transport system permease protein